MQLPQGRDKRADYSRGCAIEIEAHALVKGCHRVLLAQESCGGRSQDQRL